jgi:hypothetical protein
MCGAAHGMVLQSSEVGEDEDKDKKRSFWAVGCDPTEEIGEHRVRLGGALAHNRFRDIFWVRNK